LTWAAVGCAGSRSESRQIRRGEMSLTEEFVSADRRGGGEENPDRAGRRGGLMEPPVYALLGRVPQLLKMEIDAQLEKMISRFKLGIIIEFVFAVEIFVEKIQRKIRDQFKIHPCDELAGECRVVFIRVE